MGTSTATSSRATGWMVATGVLGVVAVALTTIIASDDDRIGASADSTAEAACGLVAQMPADGFEPDLRHESPSAHVARLSAASALAMLAAELDGGYEPLGRSVERAHLTLQQNLDASSDTFTSALATAYDSCESR